jgi:hypothetical protein
LPINNEPKILYTSKLLRANAGKIESYVIRISEETLSRFGIIFSNGNDELNDKKESIQKSIQDASALSDAVKSALNETTKDKLQQAAATRKKAKQIFHPLMLSSVSSENRNKSTYLHGTDDLKKKHTQVIKDGIQKFAERDSKAKKPPSLSISSKNTDENTSLDPKEIVEILQENLNSSSIERVFQQFPKNDYSKIAKDFINEIITSSTI